MEKRPEIDRWIISLLNTLVRDVTRSLEDYDPTPAARAIQEFVGENLSNWYVRLNRKRFWGGRHERGQTGGLSDALHLSGDRFDARGAVRTVHLGPHFLRPERVSGRHTDESVHLSTFPKADGKLIDADLEEMMSLAQRVSSMVLALRRKVSIKVRQPLTKILIPVLDPAMAQHIAAVKTLIMNEVNVKEIELIENTAGIITKRIKPNLQDAGTALRQIHEADRRHDRGVHAGADRRNRSRSGDDPRPRRREDRRNPRRFRRSPRRTCRAGSWRRKAS